MKFWNYSENGNELRIDGPIDNETWFGDEVTPQAFRRELEAHPGDLVLYINSPGGDVFAASQIYTMLLEREGSVTVKIDAVAASAASVIAMAGTTVLMAPTAYMMIHDPLTCAMGNKADLKEAIRTLDEIKEGLISAYELKTGLDRDTIAKLMEDEGTWMNAMTAMELGFCDGLIDKPESAAPEKAGAKAAMERVSALSSGKIPVYNQAKMAKALIDKLAPKPEPEPERETPEATALRQKLAALCDKYLKP
ncbi:MAG: Clp protease ClpP [Clostridiales bacterium]|nr:Clp protease ClpP [Clostridiales bacterium]